MFDNLKSHGFGVEGFWAQWLQVVGSFEGLLSWLDIWVLGFGTIFDIELKASSTPCIGKLQVNQCFGSKPQSPKHPKAPNH